jgi:transcriptional regulator GlxA family with amidase domain
MTKQLGLLLYEGVQPMDVIGPWEVFAFWKHVLHAPLEMYLISENGSWVQGDNGITFKAHCSFEQTPPLDYFIVPGGKGRRVQVDNDVLIAFIKKQAKHSEYLLSVCTGMFLLHKAGLLEGKKVTTYWRALPEVEAFKDVQVVEERIVKNPGLWLSGGVTSGIDLALALIAEVAGKETAGKVQWLLEYFPDKTAYASLDLAHSLPAYGSQTEDLCLPSYVRGYLREEKR